MARVLMCDGWAKGKAAAEEEEVRIFGRASILTEKS